jgi:hypothetical protein
MKSRGLGEGGSGRVWQKRWGMVPVLFSGLIPGWGGVPLCERFDRLFRHGSMCTSLGAAAPTLFYFLLLNYKTFMQLA